MRYIYTFCGEFQQLIMVKIYLDIDREVEYLIEMADF